MEKRKCLLLISGGLDSMLAAKLLEADGVEVHPICFCTYFFGCDSATRACSNLGLPLRKEDISDIHLEMVKKPKHGLGSAHNPCIDCHLMMLVRAREIMEAEGYDFVATGEVLGQRPMSQNRNSLFLIEKEAGLEGRIVRPLSLNVLPKTEAEEKGMINKDNYPSISGRGRNMQISLIRDFGITSYPSPSGGCILTDKNYGESLFRLFSHKPDATGSDCLLLRKGRVSIDDRMIVVIARNAEESAALEVAKEPGDTLFVPTDFSGPTILIRIIGSVDKETVREVGIKEMLSRSKNVPEDYHIDILD
jgi:tRNA U34 2-thiouridine synthase MnmA/TrmU